MRIVYIYILWIKASASNIICSNKLRTSSNSSNKLNQNITICHTLNKHIASMNKDYDELDANVDILDDIYQIPYEIGIFDSTIIIINVSDIILCQIQTVMTIYTIAYKACIFYDTILETVVYVFMLLFKFNASSYTKDLLFIHSIARKIDNFDSSIAVINLTNTLTAQVDHSYVILIVINNELLMMIVDRHSANNIQSRSNDAKTSVCTHQLDTNCSNGSNGIVCCALKKNITITFTIINCDKFITNMCQMAQFYQINIPMHDLYQITTIMGVIDTITHQIEILINATYQYAFNLSVELAILFGFELRVIRLIDLTTAEYEFLIIIRGWAIMRIEFCNGINNWNPIGRITIRIDVDDAFNGMFSVINILIKISISILFVDALMTIVDKIN